MHTATVPCRLAAAALYSAALICRIPRSARRLTHDVVISQVRNCRRHAVGRPARVARSRPKRQRLESVELGAVRATAASMIRRRVRLPRAAGNQPAAVPRRTCARRATSRRSKAASRRSMPASRAPTSPKAAARCRKIKGQVWREYDIRPYTLRVTTTARPEQAIVDWILRETGYEAWHSDPVGLLSANRETLRVYHTPEMQAIVADIVDRFVNSAASALRVHAPRGHGRQSELAGQSAADDDADPRAIARRARLAVGQGERAAAGFGAEPAHRLSRIQFGAAACEQRPVDRDLDDAAAELHSQRDRHANGLARLSAGNGHDRRRLLAGVQPAAWRSIWRRPTRS